MGWSTGVSAGKGSGTLAALQASLLLATSQLGAQTPEEYHQRADLALQSFLDKFWSQSNDYLRHEYSGSSPTGYWTFAQGFDALLDGVERTGGAQYAGLINTFFEAQDRPGGQVRLIARSGRRSEMIGIVDWRVAELERLGVELRLNTYAEADDVLAEAPEIVVVATGGLPDTKVGTFPQPLYDEAQKQGWIVISMKNDWKRIFAFEQ